MSKRKRQRGSGTTTRPEVPSVAQQLRLDGGAEVGVPVEVPVVALQPGVAEEVVAEELVGAAAPVPLTGPLTGPLPGPPLDALPVPEEVEGSVDLPASLEPAPETPAPVAAAPLPPTPRPSIGPPLGDFLTPPSGDLPMMADATTPSGDFATLSEPPEESTPVRTRLRRFATPLPVARAATVPPVAPRVPPPIRPPPSPIELAPGTEITGELLRQLREQRGVTLKEIEEVTRVRAISLAAIEAERYDELPDVKIYIRGFVQALARTIGVDAELASASYLARWDRWRERTPTPKRHFIKS